MPTLTLIIPPRCTRHLGDVVEGGKRIGAQSSDTGKGQHWQAHPTHGLHLPAKNLLLLLSLPLLL